MFNKILSLLFISSIAMGQANIISPDNVRTLKDFKNYVQNPDAEKNITTGITNASSIVTKETGSTKLDGNTSFNIDGTASGQKVKFKLNDLPNKFKGNNAEFAFHYSYTTTNSTGDYKAYVEDSSGDKVSADYNILTTGGSSKSLWGTFTPGTTLDNPYYIVIESTVASPAAMLVDALYAGDVTSIGQFSAISETVSAGTITFGATTTAPTKGTPIPVDSVSYYRSGEYAFITYRYSNVGAAGTAAGTGDYLITMPSGLQIDTSLVPVFTGTINPANGTGISSTLPIATGFYQMNIGSGKFAGAIAYSATQFRVIQQIDGGSGFAVFGPATGVAINNTNLNLEFTVKVPIQGWSASQGAAAANQTDYGWTSYTPTLGAGFGSPTNVSFKHRRNSDILEVEGTFTNGTAAASIGSISLPSTCSALDTNVLTIANTTANPGQRVGEYNTTAGWGAIVTATGTSTSLVYLASNQTGSAFLTPASSVSGSVAATGVVMSVKFRVPCSGWESNQRAPTLIGSVTSNSVSALRTEWARVTSAGVVTELGGSDWINGSCSVATSTYTCNYVSGTFSGAPVCSILATSGSGDNAYGGTASQFTSSQMVYAFTRPGAGNFAVDHMVSCTGPR